MLLLSQVLGVILIAPFLICIIIGLSILLFMAIYEVYKTAPPEAYIAFGIIICAIIGYILLNWDDFYNKKH